MNPNPATITHLHFCTYFDHKYLSRGLALHDSLLHHCKQPFTLWVLCFDEETFDCLTKLDLNQVRLIQLDDFEHNDDELLAVKTERTTVEYYWTCTPSLPLYILQQDPSIEVIIYLDADQCFYADPQPIYDELGTGSILIIEHRYDPALAHVALGSGIYNVGLMVFRRDENGMACLQWWRARCIEWCHAYHEDGKFGDQKYLDDWPDRFGGVVVLQHIGGCLAPWNLAQYSLQAMGSALLVDDQPLILFHFHGCKRLSTRVWEPAPPTYAIRAEHISYLYLPYSHYLSSVEATLAADCPAAPAPARSPHRFSAMRGLISQKYYVADQLLLSLLLWRIGEPWGRANRVRTTQGFYAYSQGRYATAQRYMLGAIVRNPALLFSRRVRDVLLQPITRRFRREPRPA